MYVDINRTDFLKLMSCAVSIPEKKNRILYFRTDSVTCLCTMMAVSDYFLIKAEVGILSGNSMSFSVLQDTMYDSVKLMEGESIRIISDGDNIRLLCVNTEFRIPCFFMQEPAFPEECKNVKKLFQIDSDVLRNQAKQVYHAVSLKGTNILLGSMNLEIAENGKTRLTAFDGHSMSVRDLTSGKEDCSYSIAVPGSILKSVSFVMEGTLDASVTEKGLILKSEESRVKVFLKKGRLDYFNMESLCKIPDDCNQIIVFRENLIQAVRLCSVISKAVDITLHGDYIKIESKSDAGNACIIQDTKNGSVCPDSLRITLPAKTLLDALENVQDESITIYFTSMYAPVRIKGEDYLELIQPIS